MGQTKAIKREEAKERQLIYDGLTPQQKIERLPIGGQSLKELSKLKQSKSHSPSKVQQHKTDKLSRKERGSGRCYWKYFYETWCNRKNRRKMVWHRGMWLSKTKKVFKQNYSL